MGQKRRRSNRVLYSRGMNMLNFMRNTRLRKRRRNNYFEKEESFSNSKDKTTSTGDFSDEEINYFKNEESSNSCRRNNYFEKEEFSNSRRRNNYYEKEESSKSKDKLFVCKICKKKTYTRDAFYLSGCSHVYCSDCVAAYISYKLAYNIIDITCPFPMCCSGSLEADFCRSILHPKVFKRWDKALCEALFNITEKFYCPFADCSALLVNDVGTEAVSKLECPNCNRMICAQCNVRWHEGIKCSEFKKLNRVDKAKGVMLANIAKDMRWRQCPKCRIYVAKSESSNIMKCRCPCKFCYKCGFVFSIGKCSCYKRNLNSDQRTFISWAQLLNDIDLKKLIDNYFENLNDILKHFRELISTSEIFLIF